MKFHKTYLIQYALTVLKVSFDRGGGLERHFCIKKCLQTLRQSRSGCRHISKSPPLSPPPRHISKSPPLSQTHHHRYRHHPQHFVWLLIRLYHEKRWNHVDVLSAERGLRQVISYQTDKDGIGKFREWTHVSPICEELRRRNSQFDCMLLARRSVSDGKCFAF